MIAFLIYLLLFLWLIHRNTFFSLFEDDRISKKQFTLLFFLKVLAVPVFYFVYKKLYGGIDNLDAGKFYNDVQVISGIAKDDLPTYLKILFGLQDDTPGNYDHLRSHLLTHNWDNGTTKDYLYNDNRILIRVYSLLSFISFSSYFVLALFSCLFSFIGIVFLYKAFKSYFEGKEILVLFILCFLPALWFYTGALLKEGLTLFIMGCLAYAIKKLADRQFRITSLPFFILLILISCLLKPYLLLFTTFSFALFFFIEKSPIKKKILVFTTIVSLALLAVNSFSLIFKDRSLVSAALKHQRIFSAVAKGGIYLTNDTKYVRLSYDTSLVTKSPNKKNVYRINKNASFMYWKNNNDQDTLFCEANKDTISEYLLVYMAAQSSSNITGNNKNAMLVIGSCLYYSLLHPMFYNAKGPIQLLASLENLALAISLLVIVIGLIRRKKTGFLPFVFLITCLMICILVSLANPNSGAIFRYRAPVVIFILLGALYYFGPLKTKAQKT